MPLSAVRQAAGIEPTGELLSRPDGLGFDDPGSLEMEGSAYRPLGWESEKGQSRNPISALYTAVEDFSEFLFRGLQKMFGAVGLTLVPAIGLALRGIILLLLGLCLLFSGMWVGRRYGPLLRGRPTPVSRNVPPTRPNNPGLDSARQARQAVLEFYAAIDAGRYQVAYNQLTPAWKRELSYAQFEKGFRSTQRVKCLVDEVRKVGESIELDVTLEATESGILRRYQGTYVAEHTANGWKLDSGSFRQ